MDLLVNVLKGNIPDLPFFLMQLLHEKGIYPKWNDTPLPAGKKLLLCLRLGSQVPALAPDPIV